jgi:ferredoxin-NADP reductase
LEAVATISSIERISPTVKLFGFDLGGVDLPFLPGQWVDLIIDTGPSVEVGGYSITSTPLQHGSIELAVKRLAHGAAAAYLHDRARVGEVVEIHGGSGGFHYEPEWQGPLVLVAGGIGITPLISILRYVDQSRLANPVMLIYSASSPSELLFQEEIKATAARNPAIRYAFTVTHPGEEHWEGPVGRISLDILRENAPEQDSLYYLCGPPSFQDDMATLVGGLEVKESLIRAERWW